MSCDTRKQSIEPSILFTTEKVCDKSLSFRVILIIRAEQGFRLSVYRKPTLTEQCQNFNPHHLYNIKKGIFRCLKHRAKTICRDNVAYQEEMKNLRDIFHRNDDLEDITSAPRNLDRTTENNT